MDKLTHSEMVFAKKRYCEHCDRNQGQRLDVDGFPILMLLSFEEWLDIWLKSGHWHERGKGKGQYCMSRVDDLGHYELGNVFIQTSADNVRLAPRFFSKLGVRKTKEHRANISIGLSNLIKSKEHCANISKRCKEIVECPHCGKQGARLIMKRWHFVHCKFRSE